ncbi:MAG TPA: hypothetical protein VLH56_00275 [Dissulfurispiraceae bacterium]|nr:hypothetical protein [Dissulfurispiraceae bacterium]
MYELLSLGRDIRELEQGVHRLVQETARRLMEAAAMTVWHATQRAGRQAAQLAAERQERLFERGEIPSGRRQADRLAVEADEVVVRGRDRGKRRHWIGLKMAIAYEGKAKAGTGRQVLMNRRVMTAVMGGGSFWRESVADMGHRWDLAHNCPVSLGGDGAKWIK